MLNSPRPFVMFALLALLLPAMLVACGGDDDDDDGDDNGGNGPSEEMLAFADAAEAEFDARGEGTFYDTGFAAFCRAGGGFDGVFEAMEFEPDSDAEFCYNTSSDQAKVALGITRSLSGPVECMVLDASSGSVVRGEVMSLEGGCLP